MKYFQNFYIKFIAPYCFFETKEVSLLCNLYKTSVDLFF